MKKITFLILLLPFLSQGQYTPGYMGKKMIVSYGLGLTLSYGGDYQNAENQGEQSTKIVSKNAVNFEYVIGKKKSLIVGLDHFTTYVKEDYAGYVDVNGIEVYRESIKNAKINSIGFSFGLKSYKAHLAPLGGNWEYRLLYRKSTAEDLITTIDTLPVMSTSLNQFGIGIGYNISRIISDCIVLEIGLMANYNFYLGDSYELDLGNTYSGSLENEEEHYQFEIGKRVQWRDYFYFKFGVGYLF